MQVLCIYLLKVIAVSGLLLMYYLVALRNKRFHFYNRFYLLFTVILSMLLPFAHLDWFLINSNSAKAINIYKIIYQHGGEDFINVKHNSFSSEQFFLTIAAMFSCIMLLRLLFRIIKIYQLKKVYPVQKLMEFDFINTDLPSAPFSFLKNVFWRSDIKLEENAGKQILKHEITHITQRHSLDKVFIQLVLCFYWINPFFWWLKNELYLIHEFIADERSVDNNDAAAFAQMLLTTKYGKFNFLPAQPFFYSSIKRRLIMLTTSKKSQVSYMRRILVLPLFAGVLCLFAFKLNEDKTTLNHEITVAKTNFKLVVDAGHGGKDDGAVGNGMYEKDVTLKIAEKMKELSSQYGIDIVLTRSSDVYMSPKEKSDFANTQNANAFISVHVNNSDKNEMLNSGMEVFLSTNNTNNLDNNKVLGSAIIQNLQPDFSVTPALQQRQVGIWILDHSNIPSVLVECGYITNANDAEILKQDNKIELIARNILQGVTMYANNKVDKLKLYQIENMDKKDTSVPAKVKQKDSVSLKGNTVAFPDDGVMVKANDIYLNIDKQRSPLFIVDGKEMNADEFKKLSLQPNYILSVNEWNDTTATKKYGGKGKYGVVEVTLKNRLSNDSLTQRFTY